jgi:hypothetical protein
MIGKHSDPNSPTWLAKRVKNPNYSVDGEKTVADRLWVTSIIFIF